MYGDRQQEGGGGGQDMSALYAAAMLAAAEEEKKKQMTYKYLEGLLPLVLLLILGVFIAAKLGFIDLSFIPGFAKPVNVLILTDQSSSPEIKGTVSALTSYFPRHLMIQVSRQTIGPKTRIYASSLSDYDVVILYQVSDKELSMQQRMELAKYVKSGGDLIVVMNSGTYIPNWDLIQPGATGSSFIGWSDQYMSSIMPVECREESSCTAMTSNQAIITTILRDHPIMGGLERIPPNSVLRLSYIPGITVSKLGREVAEIDILAGSTPDADVVEVYPGIVVSTSLTGGKVVYFNYPPYQTAILLVNTIEWLS